MAIYETFSKRQKKLSKQGESDPYRYDIFPQPQRVQIINLLTHNLGNYYDDDEDIDDRAARRWSRIHETLSHEYGVFELVEGENVQQKCHAFFLQTQKVEECLDFVELGFIWVQNLAGVYSTSGGAYNDERNECESAITELNYRLREQGVGYQFEEGKIIRVDSQYIHAEVVKPAIGLLHDANFAGASEEFLQAHEHYRAKR